MDTSSIIHDFKDIYIWVSLDLISMHWLDGFSIQGKRGKFLALVNFCLCNLYLCCRIRHWSSWNALSSPTTTLLRFGLSPATCKFVDEGTHKLWRWLHCWPGCSYPVLPDHLAKTWVTRYFNPPTWNVLFVYIYEWVFIHCNLLQERVIFVVRVAVSNRRFRQVCWLVILGERARASSDPVAQLQLEQPPSTGSKELKSKLNYFNRAFKPFVFTFSFSLGGAEICIWFWPFSLLQD